MIEDKIKTQYAEPVWLKSGDDFVLKIPISGTPRPTGTWTYGKEEIKG